MCQKTLVREEQIAIVPNNDYKGNWGKGAGSSLHVQHHYNIQCLSEHKRTIQFRP